MIKLPFVSVQPRRSLDVMQDPDFPSVIRLLTHSRRIVYNDRS